MTTFLLRNHPHELPCTIGRILAKLFGPLSSLSFLWSTFGTRKSRKVPGQDELCGWFNTMLLMLPEFLGCSRHCVNEHCHDEAAMIFSANLLSLCVLIKSEISSYVDCSALWQEFHVYNSSYIKKCHLHHLHNELYCY